MDKEGYWLLMGVLISFGMQVIYEAIGDIFGVTMKLWTGVILMAILFIIIVVKQPSSLK